MTGAKSGVMSVMPAHWRRIGTSATKGKSSSMWAISPSMKSSVDEVW